MRGKVDMDEDEKGKLFVGGLSWETTQEALQRYFSRYGDVVDCVVMKNTESGRSRGFGFVTYADPTNVGVVLQNGPHVLDGRTIDPKPCNPRTLSKPKRNNGYPKVFLGGLPSNVTETDLRQFFMRYGKVMEVVIMYDQEKKKSRGFGFLSFEDEDAVERCVADHFVNLHGKQVEIKKAEPRDAAGKMNDSANTWGAPQGGPQMGLGGGMGIGGPNGQMSGPLGGMSHLPPGNMMQSYQGWGTPPTSTGYPGQWGPSPPNGPPVNGYGTPSGGYQQWGAPPGPQSQQMPPPQWGSNYASQQQSYGSYGPPQGPQSGYSNNWNWNMPQSSGGPGQGGPGPTQGGPQGDIYSRAASNAGPGSGGPAPPGSGPTQKTPDYNYGNYGAYSQDSSSYGGPTRSYGADTTTASGNGTPGYPSHAPVPGAREPLMAVVESNVRLQPMGPSSVLTLFREQREVEEHSQDSLESPRFWDVSIESRESALSQTPRTPEYRNSRKTNRTISFKEYIEAELNSKPVFSTNQGKSKDPGFENGSKEIKSSSASTEGTRTNSSPRYSFTSPDYDGFYQVYSHEAPGPQRMGQPYTAAPPTPSYHPYRR